MISTRARNLTDLIEQNQLLERALAESEAFRDTTSALNELQDQIRDMVDSYHRVGDRLGPRIRADIRRTLEDAQDQLHETRLQLRKNPRQTNEIRKIGNRVTAASKRINEAWREWSLSQLRPHQDALTLVESLPEVQAKRTTIDAAIQRIIRVSESCPPNDKTLVAFDDALHSLASSLHDLEGLSITVRGFLGRVVAGNATLRDLNPEVMSWIDDRDRALAFQIQFRTTSGRGIR